MGIMDTDDYLRAVDLRPVPGSRLPAGRNVEQTELAALLAHCHADQRPAGTRDAAIIGLAYLSGTRRAELAALHLADLDTDPPALRVLGKGGKQRLVPLSPCWQRPQRGRRPGSPAPPRRSARRSARNSRRRTRRMPLVA